MSLPCLLQLKDPGASFAWPRSSPACRASPSAASPLAAALQPSSAAYGGRSAAIGCSRIGMRTARWSSRRRWQSTCFCTRCCAGACSARQSGGLSWRGWSFVSLFELAVRLAARPPTAGPALLHPTHACMYPTLLCHTVRFCHAACALASSLCLPALAAPPLFPNPPACPCMPTAMLRCHAYLL